MHNHALVLGKFMDFHKGHEALIRYALTKAGAVTVLLCTSLTDRIPARTRVDWIRRTLGSTVKLRVISCEEEGLPTKEESDLEVSKVWADWVTREMPEIDLIVGSEDYVTYMAGHGMLDADIYDQGRVINPCSSTSVNAGDYSSRVSAAKQELAQKIYIVGPESSGKTTAASLLATHYGAELVLEQARSHMRPDGNFDECDLSIFALAQELAVRKTVRDAESPMCIIDSSALTTLGYALATGLSSNIGELIDMFEEEDGVYLLFSPLEDWVDDGTRHMSSMAERIEFFYTARSLLSKYRKKFHIISSSGYDERLQEAKDVIDTI